ncbi:MAG: ATP-binding cassette domain-containing protein [Mariprofundaceae bacterium]
MIYAEQLSRFYGDCEAVRDLSFHVHKGEVMGLLGPNGAGKSTTMKILTCFLPPSSGQASVDGSPLEDTMTIRRKIGYLPENAPSYTDLDVHTHLTFVGRMHGIPDATLNDRIAEMSRVCGLASVMYRRIDELSKGYRQRTGLVASMLHDPPCLILDEPTTGLDPNQIVEIRHLIRRLGEKKTVLLSSHVLPEVEAACDRMMIIDNGQLQVIGTSEELARQAQGGAVLHVAMKGNAEAALDAVTKAMGEVEAVLRVEDGVSRLTLTHPDHDANLAEAMFHAVVSSGGVILEMRPEKATLEDIFRQLTGASA